MSPLASVPWRPAPKSPQRLRRCLTGVAVLAAAILAAQFLASYFFLWSMHRPLKETTPLTVARYAWYYGQHPAIRRRLWVCSGVGLGLVAASGLAFVLPKPRALHGRAQFAPRREIARAGLFSPLGMILGRLGSRLLILAGQQSVILAAPPRSGKDVGVVIPNALCWPGSIVVVDIKREVWNLTAGFRASQGQACHLLDLLAEDGRTARWNCLSYVSANPEQRINDIQRIADILYAEAPGTDPFWVASARSLFLGICLYLFETPSLPKTIGEVRRQGMASDDEGFGAHWKRIVEGRQKGRYPLSAECVRALYDVIDLAPVTASSVRKTFTSRLDLWANPLLDQATSGDDFDLRDLRKKPMSIYVAVNPDDLHRLRPILSLFFQQALGLQTRELPEHNPALKYQLLMLLNEFTALGRIPIVSEAMAYLPGYNVRVLLVIQAMSQLREVYGPQAAETMAKSVAARIVFAPKDFGDAKEISDELGFTTIKVRSHSRPSFGAGSRGASRSGNVTTSEHARALLLPQEVKEIGQDTAIIFYENVRPIRCSKIRYYADRRFRARLLPPPARPRAIADATPSIEPEESAEGCPEMTTVPDGKALTVEGPMTSTHEATLADLEHLNSLTREDFGDQLTSLTFEHAGERPTASELDADVERFLEAFH
jgi:type IV secretion system protein VirD4